MQSTQSTLAAMIQFMDYVEKRQSTPQVEKMRLIVDKKGNIQAIAAKNITLLQCLFAKVGRGRAHLKQVNQALQDNLDAIQKEDLSEEKKNALKKFSSFLDAYNIKRTLPIKKIKQVVRFSFPDAAPSSPLIDPEWLQKLRGKFDECLMEGEVSSGFSRAFLSIINEKESLKGVTHIGSLEEKMLLDLLLTILHDLPFSDEEEKKLFIALIKECIKKNADTDISLFTRPSNEKNTLDNVAFFTKIATENNIPELFRANS